MCSIFLPALYTADSPYQQNFPAGVYGDVYGQIKVVDLENDGKKEMVFGAVDGSVHVYRVDGKEKRNGFFPKHTGGPIMSDVEVADLDKDGKMEILATSFDGQIYLVDSEGKLKWKQSIGGGAVFNSPAVADLDGDGKLEVVTTSLGGKVIVFDDKGVVKWNQTANARISGPPVIADMDGVEDPDSKQRTQEIIFRNDQGEIEIFNAVGHRKENWPVESGKETKFWPYIPVVADVDGDGKKEVVISMPSSENSSEEQKIRIFSENGKIVKEIVVNKNIADKVKITDANGDGYQDLIYASEDGEIGIIDLHGTMQLDGDQVKPQYFEGWPKKVAPNIQAVPNLADVDGDGVLDLVYTGFNPKAKGLESGFVGVLSVEKGSMMTGFPKNIGKTTSRVTFADLDGDGDVEIIVSGGLGLTGKQLHVFDVAAKNIFKFVILGIEYE